MPSAKKRVTWKKGEGPIKQQLLPFLPMIIVDTQQNLHTINDVMGKIQLGTMFYVVSILEQMPDYPGRSLPPYSYLINEASQFGPTRRYPKVADVGDIIVYMGEIRVAEGSSISTVRQVLRHKFLIHGGIFIVYHLGNIVPIETNI